MQLEMNDKSAFTTCRTPSRSDGVGKALRRAFTPPKDEDDFDRLLARLDRRK